MRFDLSRIHITPSKSQAIKTAILGDWQSATSINKYLLNDNPNDIEALNRLAFAHTVLGKVNKAKAIYKKVLKLDALNPIALRNIKRLTKQPAYKSSKKRSPTSINRNFIEETGKTKIVGLVNVCQPKIIARLTTGQLLTISIKRLKIFAQNEEGQYIGALPDDLGKRLIKFIKGGNQYVAYVKSAIDNHVSIFLRETKRAYRFRNQPSFLQESPKNLTISKNYLSEESVP